jgi:CNT family concentrative nucleoside transporter
MTGESASANRRLRLGAVALAVVLTGAVYLLRHVVPDVLRALLGIVTFLTVIVACSTDIRAIRWRGVFWGLVLQLGLAVFILKFSIGGWRPGYAFFATLSDAAKQFLEFTNAGAEFVFGGLANQEAMSKVFPGGYVFAFMGLPAIVFVASVVSILYYLGVLQFIVRAMARAMMSLMHTSGAETLSAAADVFMGNTEAPLTVKPYVARMTESELLGVMVVGLATISGGMMAVYIGLGADPVGILTTSVMAAPCGLYLAKMLLPETGEPETRGRISTSTETEHVNVIDAAAAGATDGMRLALNVAAMLIAFLSLLAMADYVLARISAGLSMAVIFATVFAPAAMLLGVPAADVPMVADLLGTKLVANEFVAFIKLTTDYKGVITPEGHILATYALTGFANFGSIGVLLGGLGSIAPTRRGDLARLSGRALLGGFVATMINAAIAAILI